MTTLLDLSRVLTKEEQAQSKQVTMRHAHFTNYAHRTFGYCLTQFLREHLSTPQNAQERVTFKGDCAILESDNFVLTYCGLLAYAKKYGLHHIHDGSIICTPLKRMSLQIQGPLGYYEFDEDEPLLIVYGASYTDNKVIQAEIMTAKEFSHNVSIQEHCYTIILRSPTITPGEYTADRLPPEIQIRLPQAGKGQDTSCVSTCGEEEPEPEQSDGRREMSASGAQEAWLAYRVPSKSCTRGGHQERDPQFLGEEAWKYGPYKEVKLHAIVDFGSILWDCTIPVHTTTGKESWAITGGFSGPYEALAYALSCMEENFRHHYPNKKLYQKP